MNDLLFLKPVSVKQKRRIGQEMDGGYIVYDRILPETDVLLTYGVGWEISFEEDFGNTTSKKVLMFDPSMFKKYLLDPMFLWRYLRALRFGEAAHYLKQVWAVWRRKIRLEKRDIYFFNEGVDVEKAPRYDTITNHMERFGLYGKQILLKMDIEGKEYPIWEDERTWKVLPNINQLLIEFHDLKNRLQQCRKIVERLRKEFELIHIHGNNFKGTFCINGQMPEGVVIPDVLEMTFVRKDKISPEDIVQPPVKYPISGLDYPNDPLEKDYALDFIEML